MGRHGHAGPTVIVADGVRVYLGARYWNIGIGREIGAVTKGVAGGQARRVPGEHMA